MAAPRLGLMANWRQFSLLVLINAFVGGMVGLERSVLPQLAQEEFGIASKTAILSFITAFGISKALANYVAGRLANVTGRRNLLILGWVLSLPLPWLIIHAPTWEWVVFANILLGIHQGFAWSSTVVMKIDLAGEQNRGLAMGLNEFAGYLAVGLVAFLTGYIASHYGVRPYPFYLGAGISVVGLLLTLCCVADTGRHAAHEATTSKTPPLRHVFLDTTFRHPNLSAVTQAGLVNNLNDGMVWGLLPLLLAGMQYDHATIGLVTAVYPAVWGIGQLVTGKMADHASKKFMLVWGMALQGIAILFYPEAGSVAVFIALGVALGLGTALVYPTFLAIVADNTPPSQRAESVGVFRLWRDLGYAFGAILSGFLADRWGIATAIAATGWLTLVSAVVLLLRMRGRPVTS